jgi:1,4-dihydroxy-6-naphthoate synthase
VARPISLYYSVDADDAYMFYALREAKIASPGFTFSHHRHDTETLNRLARQGEADVIAVSVFTYAEISADYLMLPHGGSLGRNYGPVIVAKKPYTLADLPHLRLAIPGETTTAASVVRMLSPGQLTTVVPIDPFAAIFASIANGEVDAGLLIHEGRMVYERLGLHKIVDIGEWWQAEHGRVLPLGANVINRKLGRATIAELSELVAASIRWARQHEAEVLPYLQRLKGQQERDLGLHEVEMLRAYLGLYANADTEGYGPAEREAMQYFFDEALRTGQIDKPVQVSYA